MAKLTAKGRKRIKSSNFAIPEKKAYPIHDRKHAANALARVTQHGTPEEKRRVRRAVCRKYPTLPACQGKGAGGQKIKTSKSTMFKKRKNRGRG